MNLSPIVNQLLNETIDQFLNIPASEFQLETKIDVAGNKLSLLLLSKFPCGFMQASLLPELYQKLEHAFPDYTIELSLDHFIRPHQTQLTGKGLRGIKNTIAIASGKGGVGKSTVTINLAAALAKNGARVGILDADIYGPSIPLMLGKTEPVQVEGEFYLPAYNHGIQAMSIGYLTQDDPALIWRGPMLAKALLQMIDITKWDDLDYLLIDLPPGTGDIQLSLVQKIPLTAAIVVTTPQTIATQDAEKALKMFEKTNINVLGIIENMSTHVCSQCGHQEAIFLVGGAEKLCEQHKIPLLGQLPLDTAITQHCEDGILIATLEHSLGEAFTKTALRAAIELSNRPLNYADKFPNIVVK